jgi:hypothetical protein
MIYRCVTKAIIVDPDPASDKPPKFEGCGVYDIQVGGREGFTDAAKMAVEKARTDPTYRHLAEEDIAVVSIKILDNVKDY